MKDLEMIKDFAKLEGVEHYIEYGFVLADLGVGYDIYNPIIDLALNCAARDKYAVDIMYRRHEETKELCVRVGCDGSPFLWVSDAKEICREVIECILKSEGLWE